MEHNLTIQEKRIIYQILILIMKADSIIDPAEVEYLDKVFYDFGLNYAEFDHMEDADLTVLLKQFSMFNSATKEYSKKLFIEMAEADGYVHPREIETINKFIKV